jgi:hypothetical protein
VDPLPCFSVCECAHRVHGERSKDDHRGERGSAGIGSAVSLRVVAVDVRKLSVLGAAAWSARFCGLHTTGGAAIAVVGGGGRKPLIAWAPQQRRDRVRWSLPHLLRIIIETSDSRTMLGS